MIMRFSILELYININNTVNCGFNIYYKINNILLFNNCFNNSFDHNFC